MAASISIVWKCLALVDFFLSFSVSFRLLKLLLYGG